MQLIRGKRKVYGICLLLKYLYIFFQVSFSMDYSRIVVCFLHTRELSSIFKQIVPSTANYFPGYIIFESILMNGTE